jgi:hypothetical protein
MNLGIGKAVSDSVAKAKAAEAALDYLRKLYSTEIQGFEELSDDSPLIELGTGKVK